MRELKSYIIKTSNVKTLNYLLIILVYHLTGNEYNFDIKWNIAFELTKKLPVSSVCKSGEFTKRMTNNYFVF